MSFAGSTFLPSFGIMSIMSSSSAYFPASDFIPNRGRFIDIGVGANDFPYLEGTYVLDPSSYVVLYPVHSFRVAGVEAGISEILDRFLRHLVIVMKHHVRYPRT